MVWSVLKVYQLILAAYLFRRPVRTLLTVFGVALGIAASVAVRTATVDVLRSFERAVETVAGPTTLEITGGETGFEETLITGVRGVPGVQSANPVLLQAAMKPGTADMSAQIIPVLGLDLLAEHDLRGFSLTEDDPARRVQDLLRADSVWVGRTVAAEWHLTAGSTIELVMGRRRVTCRIAGILQDRSGRASSWDRLAVMDIAAAQVAFDRIGRLDRIDLITAEGRSTQAVASAVRGALPPHLTVERPARRTQQVEHMVQAFRLNLTVLSWVGMLVGMFLIYNTMAFAVAQRRRDIGLYRAVGMTPMRVAGVFLAEAGLLGVIGGIVGSAGGIVLAHRLVAVVSRTISDLYVPVSMGDNGVFEAGSVLATMCDGVVMGCLVSMAGSVGPSWDAGRTVAVRALAPGDYEAARQLRAGLLGIAGGALILGAGVLSAGGPIGGVPLLGYAATFCLLAGLSCLAPVCVTGWNRMRCCRRSARRSGAQGVMYEIALDHAARNPGRNGVTVSALMVGVAIMLGVVMMVRSFRHTVEIWIHETVVADIVVAPSGWLHGGEAAGGIRSLPASWRSRVASIPGVAAVDTYRDVRVEVHGQRVALVSRDLRLHAQRSRYLVRRGDSSVQLHHAADTGGVLLSEVLANRLGIAEGRMLEIKTPEGLRSFPVVAVFYDYATDGGKIVMDRTLYQSLWHDDLVTVYPVYLTPGTDAGRARQAIAATVETLSADGLPPYLIGNAELRTEILDIFDRTFLLTYVLEGIAVIIAMLGIVNTLVTSVLERRREFATLRAIGGSEGQIQQLVLWEAAYLGVVGIVLGVIGGGLLSVLLIQVINKQSFGWTIQMILPVGALVQAVGLAAVATLVAGYFPARWAAGQPVAEGLREE